MGVVNRTWSDEAKDAIGRRWIDGEPASSICLDYGVSRNVIIGIVSRLGLKRSADVDRAVRRAGNDKKMGPRTEARKPPKPVTGPVRIGGRFARSKIARPAPPEIAVDVVLDPPPPPEMGEGVTLMALRTYDCRWPVGDPSHEDFRFCGGSARHGSYCPHHTAIAYRPSSAVVRPGDRRILLTNGARI